MSYIKDIVLFSSNVIDSLVDRGYEQGIIKSLFTKEIKKTKKFLGFIPYKSYDGHVTVMMEFTDGRLHIERRNSEGEMVSRITSHDNNGNWEKDVFSRMLEDMENNSWE